MLIYVKQQTQRHGLLTSSLRLSPLNLSHFTRSTLPYPRTGIFKSLWLIDSLLELDDEL